MDRCKPSIVILPPSEPSPSPFIVGVEQFSNPNSNCRGHQRCLKTVKIIPQLFFITFSASKRRHKYKYRARYGSCNVLILMFTFLIVYYLLSVGKPWRVVKSGVAFFFRSKFEQQEQVCYVKQLHTLSLLIFLHILPALFIGFLVWWSCPLLVGK